MNNDRKQGWQDRLPQQTFEGVVRILYYMISPPPLATEKRSPHPTPKTLPQTYLPLCVCIFGGLECGADGRVCQSCGSIFCRRRRRRGRRGVVGWTHRR